jgi:hypothetical protein
VQCITFQATVALSSSVLADMKARNIHMERATATTSEFAIFWRAEFVQTAIDCYLLRINQLFVQNSPYTPSVCHCSIPSAGKNVAARSAMQNAGHSRKILSTCSGYSCANLLLHIVCDHGMLCNWPVRTLRVHSAVHKSHCNLLTLL